MFEHDSIADIHEDKLVEYLLAVPYWRQWMFGHFGIPEEMIYKERVPLDTAPGGLPRKGDIDVLLSGRGRFEESVAYQVKRVKVSLAQLSAKTPAKLQDLKEAVRQANLLVDVGFWKVYLYVFALIDARELDLLTEDRLHFNEIKYKISLAIGNSIADLNIRVGVFEVELVQTTDGAPTTFDQAGGHLRRPASAEPQSHELTKWVSEVFSQERPKELSRFLQSTAQISFHS
jgi:hypothetical protein